MDDLWHSGRHFQLRILMSPKLLLTGNNVVGTLPKAREPQGVMGYTAVF
jgi:hypothetical protein